MKNKQVIAGVIIAASVLALLWFFYSGKTSGPKYAWYQNYRPENDQPYGLKFFTQMLKSYTPGKFRLNERTPFHILARDEDFSEGKTDFVVIGRSIYLDSADLVAMMTFLNQGNNVFIATVDPPDELVNKIYTNFCDGFNYGYKEDTVVRTNFYHENLKRSSPWEFKYRVASKNVSSYWRSLSKEVLCDTTTRISALGYQGDNDVNFLRIKYGNGSLFIHTSPIMFTNFYMTQKDKVEYAAAVFSHLSGENMILDEVSKMPYSKTDDNPYDSPLYFIMQQPALKYAWWMIIVCAFLYILFASKRTQRVIPVLETKSNTSLEFLNVISSLHYQNPNHFDMARKKMKYFLYFIRAKYGINTQTFTPELAKRLSEKSKVDLADVMVIYDRYKVVEDYSIPSDDPERLVGLYQAIDKFYKNCK